MTYERHCVPMGFSDQDVPCGRHICYIYSDDDERLDIVSRFLKAGVEVGERLIYIADGFTPDEIRAQFGERGVDMHSPQDALVETANEAYCPGDHFSAPRMLAKVQHFFEEAIANGYTGTRGAGEMNWLTRDVHGAESAFVYEAQLTDLLAEFPHTSICQYDARRFSGEFLMDVLQVHPYMLVHGQLVENPYYVPADEFLADYQQRLERPLNE